MTQSPFDLRQCINALTEDRVEYVNVGTHAITGQPVVKTVTLPPLLDLLENGMGTRATKHGSDSGGGAPGPIDAGALETWGQIRDFVRQWLHQLGAYWSDNLKDDLRLWHGHWDLAVARGRVYGDYVTDVERTVRSWVTRIEQKYEPDQRLEWTDPCPVVLRTDPLTGEPHRCGARRILFEGTWQFAIVVNITQRTAECRSCGTHWDGERQLMQLRYDTNLVDLERELAAAADAEKAERRELTSTGPIDLP